MGAPKQHFWTRKTVVLNDEDAKFLLEQAPRYGLTTILRNAIALMKYQLRVFGVISFGGVVELLEKLQKANLKLQKELQDLNVKYEEVRDVLVQQEKDR